MILVILITIIALYTGYLFIFDIKKALLFFVALFLLAYSYKFSIIGLNMSINMLVVLSIPFCLKCSKIDVMGDCQLLFPFLFLQVTRLLMIPFQHDVPVLYQLSAWFKHSIFLFTISYLIWRIGRRDLFWSRRLIKVIVKSSLVALSYAIILIFLDGLNPYQSIMNSYLGGQDVVEHMARYYSASNTGRMFGRISSTYNHPMLWCVVIVLLFYVFWLLPQIKTTRNKIYALMCLTFICVFTSGVRAGLFALIIGFLFFTLWTNSNRIRLRLICVLIVILGIFSQNQYAQSYVNSIFESESNTQVKGSSLEMRQIQLEGCFREISECPIQGKGYGWVDYYRIETEHGDHPIILCFESLIFSVLCESGYMGVVIWILYFFILFWTNRRFKLKDSEVKKLDSMIVSYIVYTMATGGSGQDMYVFCILYTSIVTYLYQKNRSEIICHL